MAKPEYAGTSDSCKARSAAELKKEFQRQIKPILDEDGDEIEATDEAIRTLSSLKELKAKGIEIVDEAIRILSSMKELKLKDSVSSMVVPDEFQCPISTEIMGDPVVLATRQTCDRQSIQEWLDKGHQACPQAQQVLSNTVVIPNRLVREMISQWCKERGVQLTKPVQDTVQDDVITQADRDCLNSLLEKMSSSLSDQKRAAKELRRLTKWQRSFRALFGESSDAISKLLKPLSSPAGTGSADMLDPELQEDLIATVFNISTHKKNKRPVAENPVVIPSLIKSLKTEVTIKTKINAAAALVTLSEIDSNKVIIGNSDALKPLIDLLDEGHPLAMKDVLSALFKLCENPENRERAVRNGAVKMILKMIMEEGNAHVDMLLAVLARLSSQKEAVVEMGELVVPCLLRIMRENTSETNQSNCAAILLDICCCDSSKRTEIREEENSYGTLSRVAESGNSRAKRKVAAILHRLARSS